MFRSKVGGTKNLKLNNVHFGWKELEIIFLRDGERFKKQNYKRKYIVKQTIYLDSFTMMNATYTKQPLTSKTIAEILSHLSLHCNIKFPTNENYKSEWHKFYKYTGMLQSSIEKKVTSLTSQFSLLQYQVAIYGVYVERLLNHR